MTPERIFCDWKQPALDGILKFLVERYSCDLELNLGECLLVFTGAKAGRRLQEKLALYAQEQKLILTPPTFITTGSLPEKLYLSHLPVASELEANLARIDVLTKFQPECVRQIAGLLPSKENLGSWFGIAKNIASLDSELSANLMTFAEAGSKIAEMPIAPEDSRWEILAGIQEDYLNSLSQANLTDRHRARLTAIQLKEIKYQGTIIICAVRELNLVTCQMIDQLSCPVFSLIHAPESEQDAFDLYGSIKTDAWFERALEINSELIIPTVDARDQAVATLGIINDLNGNYHHSEIILGHTDQKLMPYLESIFLEAGQKLHDPAGVALSETRPGQLLAKISRFLSSRKINDFYDLIRFPEVESLLRPKLLLQGLSELDSLIANLDLFQMNHLQSEVFKHPKKLKPEEQYAIQAEEVLEDILAPFRYATRSLELWITDLQNLLLAFYPEASEFQAELEAMDSVWNLIAEAQNTLLPEVSGAEALDLFLKLVAEINLPKERDSSEIDTLGWLELQLEDAPVIVVCGMNEGLVPESLNSDPFLPQSVRKHLGLLDNERRYARDAFVLLALVNSVPHLKLLYFHFDAEGNSLLPSRLLVSSGEENFLSKVRQLYLTDLPVRTLGTASEAVSRIAKWEIPPKPEKQMRPLTILSVTAFRSYLSCPYRFYLLHILKLAEVNPLMLEMDGRLFGNLGHEVLARFIRSDVGLKNSSLENVLNKLSEVLDEVFLEQFGTNPLPAVIIQREQLRIRLKQFANWQVGWRQAGWITKEIEYPQKSAGTLMTVDGEDFHIYGRIDRIDYHPTQKIWAVFDYKLGEKTLEPEKAHRKDHAWIDLQLPLYHYILSQNGFSGEMQLGYIRLVPELPLEKMVTFVNWTKEELADACEVASDIIRRIRRQEFWPPSEQSYPGDAFASLLGTSQFIEEEADV